MNEPRPIAELLARHEIGPAGGDKDDRGALVLVAGAVTCPGAAILAAIAALRIGVGRVQIVTDPTVAVAVGVAVPEALVLGWAAGPMPDDVRAVLRKASAVCVGPGLGEDAEDRAAAVADVMPDVPLLLDAHAIGATPSIRDIHRGLVVAPNVSEAQQLLGVEDEHIALLAERLFDHLGRPVAVRGETSVVAAADGTWREVTAAGLGTPGSGDVFAGLAGALAARGLRPEAALGWAIAIHARAGKLLAAGRANPGYLARQLADTVPDALPALTTVRG